VGVVLDGSRAERWVEYLLATLRNLPGMQVAVLQTGSVVNSPPPESFVMRKLHAKSRAECDLFSEIAIPADELSRCDVLIWLAKDRKQAFQELTTHGVLTVKLGERDSAIPFWHEVSTNQLGSQVTIRWHESTFHRARAVAQGETATCLGMRFTVNAKDALVGVIRMLCEVCLDLQHSAEIAKERFRRTHEEEVGAPDTNTPSNFEAARFAASKLLRSAWLQAKAAGGKEGWFVAWRPNNGRSITDPNTDLNGFIEIPLPNGTAQMADPFLWEANGRTHLLFEEVPEGSSKGRLCALELTAKGAASEMAVVLQHDEHLSYPCIVPWNGDLFLLPEMHDDGTLDLFRFTKFPSELERVSTVLEFGVVDTTPLHVDGYWYFFTTTAEPFMETLLYVSERLDAGWKLHPASPISRSVRSSRSAGNVIRRNGRLFRPTQDCAVRYGYAMTVNEITHLTPTEFEERKVNWIRPTWMRGLLGTHTWNESEHFQVIDGNRYRRKT